jgi:phosphatidylethanolamine/phosphatidyl-N-methylethanolamine N-methyltransferase
VHADGGADEQPAAAVVSSLPLLNRPDADRLKLLADAFDLIGPRGVFVQFTYGMVSPIPRRTKETSAPRFSAEASQPVWLNLPPARVWCYRPLAEGASLRANPAEKLIHEFKAGAGRVKDEILETCDRIETEIRLARERVRIDFERRAARVRNERAVKPAIELLRRIGEPRKRR